jgi:KUP system potassium uptake protein
MTIWYLAKKLIKVTPKLLKLKTIKKVLVELSADLSIPKYAHLVYMTNASRTDEIEEK